MRVKLIALICLALPLLAGAQVSFVTVTGSNTNYPNGTMRADFVVPANASQASYSSQRFSILENVPLNSSGAWSLSVADNTSLVPPLSQWQLTLCSQGTYLVAPTCYKVTMPVTCIHNSSCSGSTLDLTSVFAAAPVPPAPGTGTFPGEAQVIAGNGAGGAVAMPEKGVTISGVTGLSAWDDDFNAGVYDPRDPRWGPQATPLEQTAALQAMSNQMACDLSMGLVAQAVAKFPQGSFAADELVIAPGSSWEGTAQADGGTFVHSIYNNHPLMTAPLTMTVMCSDGNSHTDSVGLTHVTHFTLVGCATGGCTNAPGDNASYLVAGPYNTGLEFTSNGIVEHVFAENFGGYGIRLDGQDQKTFHDRVAGNSAWYYYGGYKGVTESTPSGEVTGTVASGSTGSVALSWPAVSGATGYVIYRGTTSGGQNVFYQSATNSFADTGQTGVSNPLTKVVTNALAAPAGISATGSTTGGTLPAATYYYKLTATVADGWHGSMECCGTDGMADWIELYGLFDAATTSTYHHLADFLGGGGNSHMDHLWPQLGQVGIAQPYGFGAGDQYTNVRVDFARLEGIWSTDSISVLGGMVDGSCTSSNAATLNTGQVQSNFAGTCDQFMATGQGTVLTGVVFSDNAGYGPTYKTADVLNQSGTTFGITGTTRLYQWIPGEGSLAGQVWLPTQSYLTAVTVGSGSVVNMMGLASISPQDSSPATINAFQNMQNGQDFYIQGGNSNVTINYSPPFITTCSHASINLGAITGFLHFQVINSTGDYQTDASVAEVCPSSTSATTVASSETVTYSATPTFSGATRASIITLTGSVTSFTLPAGSDGQEKTLSFCNDATGGYTVAAPANVHGFMTVGTTASKCSSQHFTYSAGQTAWLADSPGVTNQ
jgi:hypothetical protein